MSFLTQENTGNKTTQKDTDLPQFLSDFQSVILVCEQTKIM